MAELTVETVQKALAGETTLNAIFGFSEEQIQGIAAIGYQLYEQGKMEQAAEIFRGLMSLDTTSYLGFAGMGAVALAQEPPALDSAVTFLKRATELNSTDPSIFANLGEAYLRQGKFDEAAATFEKALDLDPEEEDAGANRARAIIDGMEIVIGELQKMEQSA
ncbi:MAG: tetratricopeptide repeat protein [Bryobacteraceae bacterium]